MLIFILIFISANAYSDTDLDTYYCYKTENCKAGDIIILEFNTMTKLNVVKRVAEVCNFDKTIYQYENTMNKMNVSCVYLGKKRLKRKK